MEEQRIKQEDLSGTADDPFVFPANPGLSAAPRPDTAIAPADDMSLENQITDLPLFMSTGTTPSEASLHNPELLASHLNGIASAKNSSMLTPNIASSESPTSAQLMHTLTPLNADKAPPSTPSSASTTATAGAATAGATTVGGAAFPSNGIPDSYTLSNYCKPEDVPVEVNSDVVAVKKQNHDIALAKDELLDTIKLENGMLSNEVTSHELTTSQSDDSKSLTAVKKTNKKKPLASMPVKRPAFVVKLWKMVNDPANDHYISWMEKGDAFQVKDRESFMKYVLPKYFKHNNFASFVRQLNMYGWHKIQDVNSGALVQTDEVWQFENPNFLKGREDLLDNIVRNKPARENEEEEVDFKQLMSQLEQMKRNQMLITEDLRRVRQDNEMLWKENFIARERHKIQSETLDKIMRFLASIYGNNTTRLIEQMNGNPGDLVEVGQNNNNYGSNHYPNEYGYYVSTNSSASGVNTVGPENMGDGMNVNTLDSNANNQMYRHQVYNNRHPNQIQQIPQQGYNTPSSNKHYQQNGSSRRQLMITNRSHDITPSSNPTVSPESNKSNELRMNSLGYVPSQADDIDSSIQEIHRGPENRNSNSTSMNNIQHMPSFVDSPRPFAQPQKYPGMGDGMGNDSNIQMMNNNSSDFNYPIQRGPYTTASAEFNQGQKQIHPGSKRQSYFGQPTPIASVSSVPMFDPSDSYNSNSRSSNINLKTPTDNMPNQLMGNIHQQLHKNQGALKQVNDWLNKYNDNLETDNMSLPEDFKVDDFLQQPLDLNGVGATPVDFSSVDGFINTDSPIQTPVLSHPLLDVPNGKTPIIENSNGDIKKRQFSQVGLNEAVSSDGSVIPMVDPSSSSNSAKRFKAVQ